MLLTKTLRSPLWGTLFCAAALAGVTGCTATVTATPLRSAVLYSDPVVYVEQAPPGVYRYPSAHYHGRPAYLVGSRWYYESNAGWVYFKHEPTELGRARVTRRYASTAQPEAQRPRYIERRRNVDRDNDDRDNVDSPNETRRRHYD